MKNSIKYCYTPLFVLTLSVALLMSASLALAKSTDVKSLESPQAESITKQQVVNLNKSTFEQLITLKGVGHTRAQAIIVYRQEVGSFKSIDELMEVNGIGEKIVLQNKARLSI